MPSSRSNTASIRSGSRTAVAVKLLRPRDRLQLDVLPEVVKIDAAPRARDRRRRLPTRHRHHQGNRQRCRRRRRGPHAHAWALGAGGEPALKRMLEIVEFEMRTSMGLLGVTSLAQLNGSYMRRADASIGRGHASRYWTALRAPVDGNDGYGVWRARFRADAGRAGPNRFDRDAAALEHRHQTQSVGAVDDHFEPCVSRTADAARILGDRASVRSAARQLAPVAALAAVLGQYRAEAHQGRCNTAPVRTPAVEGQHGRSLFARESPVS